MFTLRGLGAIDARLIDFIIVGEYTEKSWDAQVTDTTKRGVQNMSYVER